MFEMALLDLQKYTLDITLALGLLKKRKRRKTVVLQSSDNTAYVILNLEIINRYAEQNSSVITPYQKKS